MNLKISYAIIVVYSSLEEDLGRPLLVFCGQILMIWVEFRHFGLLFDDLGNFFSKNCLVPLTSKEMQVEHARFRVDDDVDGGLCL